MRVPLGATRPPHKGRMRRYFARYFLPYSSRLPNSLNLSLICVALLLILCDFYVALHNLPGWPWEHWSSLYVTTSTLPVHYSEKDDHALERLVALVVLPFAPFVVWGLLGLWKRSLWTKIQWRHVYPFFIAGLATAQLWNTLALNDTLRLSGNGIWFRWGLVRWSQIQTYHWDRSIGTYAETTKDGRTIFREEPTGNNALTLYLSNPFPYSHMLTWVIPAWHAHQTDEILVRYLPRRGNHLPHNGS